MGLWFAGHATIRMHACGNAGQWKSIAFLKYLDEVHLHIGIHQCRGIAAPMCQADLEKETAFAVAIESDEEEWIE